MELSNFIAQLLGLTIIIFSVMAMLRPGIVRGALSDIRQNSFATLLAGYMAVVVGLAIVLSHNVWDGSWRVIISIVGWLALVKGAMYVLAPGYLVRITNMFTGNRVSFRMLFIVALVFGIFLTARGFGY